MTTENVVELLSKMYDYISAKTNDAQALLICTRLGLDNPHILKTRTYSEWCNIVDKLLLARSIFGQKNDN